MMVTSKLVAALLTAVSGYTGYAIPGEPPRIVSLPHEVLAKQVCGRACQVFGFTLPDGEILLDEALAVGRDAAATSILVHELTHFLQMNSVAHSAPVDCERWNEREREAFDVQARWLRDNSASIQGFSVAMAQLNFAGTRVACPERVQPAALPPSR